jgi:hypothetical protein
MTGSPCRRPFQKMKHFPPPSSPRSVDLISGHPPPYCQRLLGGEIPRPRFQRCAPSVSAVCRLISLLVDKISQKQ